MFCRSKACADAGLLDENLMRRSLDFYASLADYLTCLMTNKRPGLLETGSIKFPVSQPASDAFSALPEWYVEDIAEFLLFALQ